MVSCLGEKDTVLGATRPHEAIPGCGPDATSLPFALSRKSEYDDLVTKEVPTFTGPVFLPTMTTSMTDQRSGLPTQLSRSLPGDGRSVPDGPSRGGTTGAPADAAGLGRAAASSDVQARMAAGAGWRITRRIRLALRAWPRGRYIEEGQILHPPTGRRDSVRRDAGRGWPGLPRARAGLGAAEVVVVLAIVAVGLLALLAMLPRSREKARAVACQQNLRQIGKALTLYAEENGAFPSVPQLGPLERPARPGPLAAMLGDLGLDDFRSLGDEDRPKGRGAPGLRSAERPVPGFTCPSDPGATSGRFPAPVSYRAVAGAGPDGRDGPFAPGRRTSPAEIEAADGLAYTAAFVERLVGDGRDGSAAAGNFALVPDPITIDGAPTAPSFDAWRGGAGSSWADADWRSSLANHALPPGGHPSLIAADGRTARMGASSGHGGRVHALILDGSVRAYSYRTDLTIWRALATTRDRAAPRADAGAERGPAPRGPLGPQ